MSGLIGARLVGEADDSTERMRRHAVWFFPAAFLLHAIPVRALAPELQGANLIVAVGAAAAGLAFRWMRRATAVIAVVIAFTAFLFLYVLGVAIPLSYLMLIGYEDWVLVAATAGMLAFGALLVLRVRSALRGEWSQPLNEVPGVHIATQDWVLRREFGVTQYSKLTIISLLVGAALVLLLALSRGQPEYQFLALLVGPVCIAVMCTDGIARWLGFYVAVRRWEGEHRVQLRFPELRWRRAQRRQRRSSKK